MQGSTMVAARSDARTRVLVVDDSALIRKLLTEIINAQPDMVAVGAARDPYVARDMIRELDPDVLTLDIEMPRMDGLDFLEKLMRLRPMPVVLVSTLTEKGSDVTMRGLELGAIDFVSKPKIDIQQGLAAAGAEIADKIRAAAVAHIRRSVRPAEGSKAPVAVLKAPRTGTEKLIVIGASTGGTEAVRAILECMPHDAPGIVVTQHMPPGFTASFARRLDGLCRVKVKEAEHEERILPGHAYIAPGGLHLRIGRSGANYVALLSDDAPINRHRPSVEALFLSAAQCAGGNAVGVMLTGMGKDGATAMLEMKKAGAWNIAQDEATCVVYGMPREAVAVGAVDEVLPLERIAAKVLDRLAAAGSVRNRL